VTALSAVVITCNEEQHLPGCLASLHWADETLVLDSFSTDRTVPIALEAGAQVQQHSFVNFAAQRDAALQLAHNEWVLFVDADERVTEELRMEIQELLLGEGAPRARAVGYWIPRQNYIFGAWVRHSGWYPDSQLRLMLRARAHYDPARPVHELVQLDGPEGVLAGHLVHLNYESIGEFVRKQETYARYDALQLRARGLRARPHNFILQPLRELRRRLVSLEGYRDGWRGFLLSVLMAWYIFEVYRMLAAQNRMRVDDLDHPPAVN
jgi:glycosyltransferase involved in cell wall biosynthesis